MCVYIYVYILYYILLSGKCVCELPSRHHWTDACRVEVSNQGPESSPNAGFRKRWYPHSWMVYGGKAR